MNSQEIKVGDIVALLSDISVNQYYFGATIGIIKDTYLDVISVNRNADHHIYFKAKIQGMPIFLILFEHQVRKIS